VATAPVVRTSVGETAYPNDPKVMVAGYATGALRADDCRNQK
jgi:hypothetical protein